MNIEKYLDSTDVDVDALYNELMREWKEEYHFTDKQCDLIWWECWDRWHYSINEFVIHTPEFADFCNELLKADN